MFKVAYLGTAGDFTEEAIARFFRGVEVKPISCDTCDEVVLKVENREVEYGFIPIENKELIKKQNLYKIYEYMQPKSRTTFAIFRIKEGY